MPRAPHARHRVFRWLGVGAGLAGFGVGWLWWAPTDTPARAPARPAAAPVVSASPADVGAPVEASPGERRPPPATRPTLFTWERPAEAAAWDAALPAPAARVDYVRVNTALLTGKASPFWRRPGEGRLIWPLPDGGELSVVIEASELLGAGRFISTGHVEGQPGSRALFAVTAGFVHAEIADPRGGTQVLRVAAADYAQVYTVDPARVPTCGGALPAMVDGDALAAAARRRVVAAASTAWTAAGPAGPAPLAAAENSQRADVHVMMVATQAVLATLSGAARTAALQSAFDLAIARVNADLAASNVTARVRLVQVAETTYDETQSAGSLVQAEALKALRQTADGQMDELHALRDASGADLVCLALNRADFANSGLAYVLNKPGDTTNALFAFSVVQYGNIAGTSVVSHEFGHTFGCAHDRENAADPGAYPYSYGYRFTGADGRIYRDIMAYPPGTQLPFFANPALTASAPANAPLGIEAGRAGEADAARTIEQAALEVANYRLQTLAPPAAGTLVNIATRATVGPGDRAAIAGFTVAGNQPKTMLLRAVGPTLASFGVSGLLAAPTLQLFAGATPLAQNAGWTTGGGVVAGELAAAAVRAGAFALLPGSADAALLVTLPPGAYTAVVGSGDRTGAVLVEAYETGPTGPRIVNLSTRAWADRATPLIAGFVVQGAPGTTKRMLIRALGPTLARAPFAVPNAMDDPQLEVRNAAGALVLLSDDWSTGAEGGAGPVNDFTPLVRYYNEQQIARTGFAPPNRREPCLLVDLPPGGYTVVVRPYELLPDEPAVPGITLVEVYEISP